MLLFSSWYFVTCLMGYFLSVTFFRVTFVYQSHSWRNWMISTYNQPPEISMNMIAFPYQLFLIDCTSDRQGACPLNSLMYWTVQSTATSWTTASAIPWETTHKQCSAHYCSCSTQRNRQHRGKAANIALPSTKSQSQKCQIMEQWLRKT